MRVQEREKGTVVKWRDKGLFECVDCETERRCFGLALGFGVCSNNIDCDRELSLGLAKHLFP